MLPVRVRADGHREDAVAEHVFSYVVVNTIHDDY